MKALTPALAQALEQLESENAKGRTPLSLTEAVLAAYRAAPDVEGPWEAVNMLGLGWVARRNQFLNDKTSGWMVINPLSSGDTPETPCDPERTVKAYAVGLNAAEAHLKEGV